MKMESFIKVSILNNKHIGYTGRIRKISTNGSIFLFYNECN